LAIINTILGIPLGFIIYFAYQLTNSYGLAIIIFAVIVKIVMFPVMILAHKNSIRLLQLQPALNIIKRRYAGDKERLDEEQYELFKKEGYSPLLGMVPLLLQLILIMGMLQVMYHPLQHILRLPPDLIEEIVQIVRVTYADGGGFTPQLRALDSVYAYLEMNFLGLNLGVTPSLMAPSAELFVPLASALVALAFCLVQNAISPGALSQSARTNLGLTVFTVGLSLYFAFALPVGVGLYWTVGNFAAIGVVLVLNLLLPPRKLAAQALDYIEANRKTSEQVAEERIRGKELKAREKADAARFSAAKKRLVFYAISGGQYKFYKNIVEYILENSDIVIHYLTNDPNDAIFRQKNDKLLPYYAGQKKTISLMLKLDADMFVTTVPDLQTFHLKRSVVRDDIEYVYIFHAPIGTFIQYKERAFDHFDTIFCVGAHHVSELRRREEMAKLPKRKLVKAGYCMYDRLAEDYAQLGQVHNEKPLILIAPSWQKDNLFETCIDDMLGVLLGKNYRLVARPHPQFTRLFPERMAEIARNYADYVKTGELTFELDFAANDSIFSADLLITDWSGIAYEFSYCTSKPCIFINTPQKIMNPNYQDYELDAMEVSVRDKIGVSVNPEDIPAQLGSAVTALLEDEGTFKERIKDTLAQYVFHPGRSGEAGGRYIVEGLGSG